ncbi:hypothetical protein ABS71_19365 [bacterium SCN 62-11]|nr:MAG: hypothetical protein ABS71_19365 [bacterium SCN 62-11]
MELESGRTAEGTLNLLSCPNFHRLIGVALDWDLQPESREILRRVEREWQNPPEHPPLSGDPVGGSLALFRCGKRFLEGNPGQALAEASRAWTCHPTYRAAVVCANLLAHLDLHQEALEMWEQALRLPDADAYGWGERGEFRLRLGDARGALEDLNRAVEMAPDSHRLHAVRSRIHECLGLHGLARKDEFQALRLRPEEQPLRERSGRKTKSPPRFGAMDAVLVLALIFTACGMLRVIFLILREASQGT